MCTNDVKALEVLSATQRNIFFKFQNQEAAAIHYLPISLMISVHLSHYLPICNMVVEELTQAIVQHKEWSMFIF
jgi:hypothetical protein